MLRLDDVDGDKVYSAECCPIALFSAVKREEAERFPTYSDAKMALFDYI